jgi:O-6-methylguanine DNA methyltransferase
LIALIVALEFYLVIKFVVVATRFGWVGVGGSEGGLVLLTLPKSSRKAALSEIKELAADAGEDTSAFSDLPNRLQRYFNGKKILFTDRLDLSSATTFQRAVWNATLSIPYGETRTYAWVAQQIGKPRALRAVGRALARNQFPIIVPCHRVIASDGNLGGFSGGLVLKKRLLGLESGRLGDLS